ncbi:MAG: DUF835 domain-containing protein, partial [Thermoplasmata archaeon]|nr:DUF835 domain-containing protein [Thermoplasmata archaeon]
MLAVPLRAPAGAAASLTTRKPVPAAEAVPLPDPTNGSSPMPPIVELPPPRRILPPPTFVEPARPDPVVPPSSVERPDPASAAQPPRNLPRPQFVTVPPRAAPVDRAFVAPRFVTVPAPEPAAPAVEESPSGVAIFEGDSTDPVWNRFLDSTAAGHRGICLSREFPFRLRALLGPRNVEVIWLSNAGRDNAMRPGELGPIEERLRAAVRDLGVTAVYLESLEYLIRLHGPEKIQTYLVELDGLARQQRARIFVPVNPSLIDPAVLDALRTRFPASAA